MLSNDCFMLCLYLEKRQTLMPRQVQPQWLSPWFLTLSRWIVPLGQVLPSSRAHKIRGMPKHLYQLSSSFFRNAVYLHFTQPYSTAGLISLLLLTAGDRGARTTSSPHNGVLDGCSLFPSHQTLFDE